MWAGEEIVRCYRPALTSQQSIQLHIFSTEDDVSDNLKVNISFVLVKRPIYFVFLNGPGHVQPTVAGLL